jgi:asparagine synthase (glutamine-hydrolysing)
MSMYRFVALLWDPLDARSGDDVARITGEFAQHHDAAWECAVSLPGMRVLIVPPKRGGLRSYVLPHDGGIVLGRLFRRTSTEGPSALVDQLDDRIAGMITATDGRQLVEGFWGSYVAFLADRASARKVVVRDCSGKLPCFKSRADRISVYFADAADALRVRGLRFSVDWKY